MFVTINAEYSSRNIRLKKDRPTYDDCKEVLNQCFTKNDKSKEIKRVENN